MSDDYFSRIIFVASRIVILFKHMIQTFCENVKFIKSIYSNNWAESVKWRFLKMLWVKVFYFLSIHAKYSTVWITVIKGLLFYCISSVWTCIQLLLQGIPSQILYGKLLTHFCIYERLYNFVSVSILIFSLKFIVVI